MKIFYVIRSGWNAANQSSMNARGNPKNQFESRQYMLCAIVEADQTHEAIEKAMVNSFNGQFVFCETNPKAIKGLTQAIRDFSGVDASL